MAKIGVMIGKMFNMDRVGIIAMEQVRNLNKPGSDSKLILLHIFSRRFTPNWQKT